jgi:hypothetical protein
MMVIDLISAAVCNGNTMGVAAKIGKHLIWTAEWGL